MTQDHLLAHRVFCRVAELKSFHKAAENLGLSKTYVSALIAQLEQQLGSRLLARTTRTVQLTADGQLFYPRCLELLASFDELQQLFMPAQGQLSGRLRLDLPTGIARHLVLPALPAALLLHPALQLEISSTDRKIDLVAEGVDVALRIGSVDSEGLVARPLGQVPLVLAASPAYLQRCGTPQQLADLLHQQPENLHRQIDYLRFSGDSDPGLAYLQDGALMYCKLPAAVSVRDAFSYETACLQGLGIIQVPLFAPAPGGADNHLGKHFTSGGLAGYFARGELVQLLPDLAQPGMPVTLLYPHRRHLTPRLQWALNWLTALVQPLLRP